MHHPTPAQRLAMGFTVPRPRGRLSRLSTVGRIVDVAGATMLGGLGIAMSLMAYVLVAGSPRG